MRSLKMIAPSRGIGSLLPVSATLVECGAGSKPRVFLIVATAIVLFAASIVIQTLAHASILIAR